MIERIFISTTPARSAIQYLEQKGWPPLAAAGIIDHLSLGQEQPNICRWQGCRLSKMLDWCSASERDPSIIEAQLEYLDYDLRNVYHKIGEQVRAAETAQEARKAFAPYIDAQWIKEGEIRWLTRDETTGTTLH